MTAKLEGVPLNITNRHLLIFADDTGHEKLVAQQPYYGLGGLLTTGEIYEAVKGNGRVFAN